MHVASKKKIKRGSFDKRLDKGMQQATNKLDTLLMAQKAPRSIQHLNDEVKQRNKQLEEQIKQIKHGKGKHSVSTPSRASTLFVDGNLFDDMCSEDESVLSSQDDEEEEEEEEEENDESEDIGESSSEERGEKRKADASLQQSIGKRPRSRQYNTVEEARRIQIQAEQALIRREEKEALEELNTLIRENLKAIADQRQLLSLAEIEATKSINALEAKEKQQKQATPPLFAIDHEKERAALATQEESLNRRANEMATREKTLKEEEARLKTMVTDLDRHEQTLKEEEVRLKTMVTTLNKREQTLKEEEARLKTMVFSLDKREHTLKEEEARLKTMVTSLDKREHALKEEEARLNKRANTPILTKNENAVDAMMTEVIRNNTMQMTPQEFATLLPEQVKQNLAFLALKPAGIKACSQTVGTHDYLYIREASESERVLLKMCIAKQLLNPK